MNLNTASFNDFVVNAEILWQKGQMEIPRVFLSSGIYKSDPLARNTGEDKEYSEIDREQFARIKSENGRTQNILAQQGYNKRMVYYEYDGKASISRKMRDENKYERVVSELIGLGNTIAMRQEMDLAHRLTFGTATSYTSLEGKTIDTTVGDGLALFSASHTLRGTSSTYSNRISGDPQLSQGAFEAGEKVFIENTLNQFGEKMVSKPDILLTTDDPNTVNTAQQILNSMSDIDSSNSGVMNVYKNKFRHVQSGYIATTATGAVDTTKRKYWFLFDSRNTPLRLSQAIPPELRSWKDDDTQEYFFANYGKYGICALTGKGAAGSFPTAV